MLYRMLVAVLGSGVCSFVISVSASAQAGVVPGQGPVVGPATNPTPEYTITTDSKPGVLALRRPRGGCTKCTAPPLTGKITVDLLTAVEGAKATAEVSKAGEKTSVSLALTGLKANDGSYNLYAVDQEGKATLLAPVTVSNGEAKVDATTPLQRFMLVLTPKSGLTTLTEGVPIVLTSEVPEGFDIVPQRMARPRLGGVRDGRLGRARSGHP